MKMEISINDSEYLQFITFFKIQNDNNIFYFESSESYTAVKNECNLRGRISE